MEEHRYRKLHEFMKENAGDAYRTAFAYDSDSWETIYVREGLATESLHSLLPEVFERARSTRALLPEDDHSPLGETHATTEVHENGVILHFPESERRGIVVTLDRIAARDLADFVTESMTILGDVEAE